ncbi:MAG: hypothetical protein JRD89_14645 [Deltaproteobacteria bacterium]|nr:hypothetical protein [Deltaproteobacteria bacterium]
MKKAVRALREKGYEKQVTTTVLRKELTRQTGTTRDQSLSNYMKTMVEFNLIAPAKTEDGRGIPGVWVIQDEEDWEI